MKNRIEIFDKVSQNDKSKLLKFMPFDHTNSIKVFRSLI